MKESKLLLLISLSLSLLALPSMAESSPPQLTGTENVWGIDPARSYPGTTVIELLDAAADEAELSIKESFSEGYKAALLETAPEVEYWRTSAESWKSAYLHEQSRLRLPWWSVILAAAAGGMTALAVR